MKQNSARREEIIKILSAHREGIVAFGVKSLYLFGSLARGDATAKSDVDLLVEFASPPGFDRYMGLKFYLEDLLHRPVDLVMKTALKPWARPAIEREAIHVA
jgi:predicted nucleotidyltransferase